MASKYDELSFDELEGQEDEYAAAQSSLKRSTAAQPDEDEDDEDHPSVEEELAKRESGEFGIVTEDQSSPKDKRAKKGTDATEAAKDEDQELKSDLDYIEEAAGAIEAERDELFNSEDEE